MNGREKLCTKFYYLTEKKKFFILWQENPIIYKFIALSNDARMRRYEKYWTMKFSSKFNNGKVFLMNTYLYI